MSKNKLDNLKRFLPDIIAEQEKLTARQHKEKQKRLNNQTTSYPNPLDKHRIPTPRLTRG